MKATRQQQEPAFIPVTITLESQAEVDAMRAILEHRWINETPEIARALGTTPWLVLHDYVGPDYSTGIVHAITANIRARAAK